MRYTCRRAPGSPGSPCLQELMVSPKGKPVIDVVLVVLRNNTLTPLQYLKGKSTYWRVRPARFWLGCGCLGCHMGRTECANQLPCHPLTSSCWLPEQPFSASCIMGGCGHRTHLGRHVLLSQSLQATQAVHGPVLNHLGAITQQKLPVQWLFRHALQSTSTTCCDPLPGFLAGLQFECLQGLIRKSKLDFPNTAFILNLHDLTVCDKASRCPAPIFSTYGHKGAMDFVIPVGDPAPLIAPVTLQRSLYGRGQNTGT